MSAVLALAAPYLETMEYCFEYGHRCDKCGREWWYWMQWHNRNPRCDLHSGTCDGIGRFFATRIAQSDRNPIARASDAAWCRIVAWHLAGRPHQ